MKISHFITARPSKLSRPKVGQRKAKALLFVGAVLLLSACAQPGKGVPLGEIFSAEVFAGGTEGYADGRGTAAQFDFPTGIAIAPDGIIYVVDASNDRIRKITPSGEVSTFAGSTRGFADEQGTAAQFNFPAGIAIAPDGTIYVSDLMNSRIRKITPSGLVSTLAGNGTRGFAEGQGAAARFNFPVGIAIAADGMIYVADAGNGRIRKITPSGLVSTFTGIGGYGFADGEKTVAQFNNPQGIAFDAEGNLFVADAVNHRIRKITPSGFVSTFAGSGTQGSADGQGTAAQFENPRAVAFDAYGNLFVVDRGIDNFDPVDNTIRVVKPTGKVTTIFHAAADDSGLDKPSDIAVTPDSSTVYIADGNRIVRMRFR